MNPTPPARGAADAKPAGWLAAHGDVLYRFALLRVGEASEAEDLVQETLLAAWRGRSSFSGGSSERTWLVGILKHKLLDRLRRSERTRPETQDEGLARILSEEFARSGKWRVGPRSWAQDPADACQAAEFWDILRRCLLALPPRTRYLFVERELGEQASEDICKLLEISPTNLWTLLHRARTRLRKCLEEHWFAPPDPRAKTPPSGLGTP